MTEINLYNTRTRAKERFAPIDPGNVRMYVCGPTVYDRAHIGNARPAVVFDVLFRLLRHTYGEAHVTYVRNVTDVDDKINARAEAEKRPIRELTDETLDWYHADMEALGVLPPTREPRATEFIGPMVAMIETLIANGNAYEAEGHVLFSVSSYPAYGRFANRSLDEMRAGARVEVAPYKRDPMDFVLWKPSTDAEPGWPSPWGHGRPGWHIECSAMSHELLGPSFDIHGGGIDLVFPHHENEIAQSMCAHPEGHFANVWMHNGFLNVEGEKMSKSLGNFFTVRDLLDRDVDGQAVRWLLLSTHYRSPFEWTEKRLSEATTKLTYWQTLRRRFQKAGFPVEGDSSEIDAEVIESLADDLNTPDALNRRMSELITKAHLGDAAASQAFFATLRFLGFDLESLFDAARRRSIKRAFEAVGWTKDDDINLRIEAFLAVRRRAREERDFAKADAIRDGLIAAGVVLQDRPSGETEYERGPSFDAVKLVQMQP